MRKLIVIILGILLTPLVSQAQFGKFLKDKAKSLASEKITLNNAKSLVKERLEKAKEEYDSTSFNYAISLSDNAGLFEVRERQERQKKLLLNYLEYSDNNNELDPLQKARLLVDNGEMLYANNKFKAAKRAFELAKIAFESESAQSDPYYAKTVANLGLLAHTVGRYTKSEEWTLQGMSLREEVLGKQSHGYAASINNYALLLKDLGQYNESERLMKESIDLHRKYIGEKSMGYAVSLNNKAMLFQSLGRYEEAIPLMKQSIKIVGDQSKSKNVNYQRLMTNLALLYHEMGKYEEAEAIYLKALSIKEKRGQKKHPDYAHTLNNLASLYMDMEKYDKVESMLKQAIEIYEAKFGENHPSLATTVSHLGNFYRFQEDYEKALPLLKKSLAIRKTTLSEYHPEYIQSKEDLAILAWKSREYDRAATLYKEVLTQTLEFVDTYFPPMSEAEKTRYWEILHPRFERFYSFVNDGYKEIPSLLKDMYGYQLFTKGILLSTSNRIKQQILTSDDESLKSLYFTWVDQKESLARYYSYSNEELKDEDINLDSMVQAANSTEKQLSSKSSEFNDNLRQVNITYKEVMKKLSAQQAAIEIVRHRVFEQNFTDQVSYSALVLTNNPDNPIELVKLTNGKQLETRYFKYYNNAIHQKVKDEYSYDQYWAKISESLKGIRQISISADGIFHQINLNTLQSSDGQFNLNRYDINLVGNTKSLTTVPVSKSITYNASLIGFPSYGGNGDIPELPGTEVEIDNIYGLLRQRKLTASRFKGEEASEANIKKMENPSILHIATHGFFLEDAQFRKQKLFGIQTENAQKNPLLRSGLMLANAGEASSNMSISNDDNGILTAYEAMNLTLANTDLVVLSACETGLGDVKTGEGVYGLQRAFIVAGAKAVVMSLWKVDDQATQALMTAFYREWVINKDKHKSFKIAQEKLMEKYPDPYYWGAFILING
jgi:CHAT domain-containing protein